MIKRFTQIIKEEIYRVLKEDDNEFDISYEPDYEDEYSKQWVVKPKHIRVIFSNESGEYSLYIEGVVILHIDKDKAKELIQKLK